LTDALPDNSGHTPKPGYGMNVPLPSQSKVEDELLLLLGRQSRPIETKTVYAPVAESMELTIEQRRVSITTAAGRENAWENLVRQARRRLVDDGIIEDSRHSQHGYWALTAAGRNRARIRSRIKAGIATAEELGF
jgi:hypothetical protein